MKYPHLVGGILVSGCVAGDKIVQLFLVRTRTQLTSLFLKEPPEVNHRVSQVSESHESRL